MGNRPFAQEPEEATQENGCHYDTGGLNDASGMAWTI
jgi:hypothetical protein